MIDRADFGIGMQFCTLICTITDHIELRLKFFNLFRFNERSI